MISETLYKKDSNGRVRVWTVTALDDALEIEHGVLGGSLQIKYEEVPFGKANRTKEEQIHSRLISRVNKQMDKGYVRDLNIAASSKPVNALGLCQPMLAHKYRDYPVDFKRQEVYVQRKYDGNRCIIHHHPNNGLIAYSRNGKPISSIGHILDGLELPVGASIDGELYCHGFMLQQIASWIKRKQEDTLKLKYHAYDMIVKAPFPERFKQLCEVKGNIEIVDTWAVSSEENLKEYHARFRAEGYEGTIIRLAGTRYEDGRRSKNVLKVKDFDDEEFLVIDVVPSKDQWAVLVCTMANGNTFRVTAPGTIQDKEEVLLNKGNYIGKRVTVEYAYLTEDGIPFHPVSKCWR